MVKNSKVQKQLNYTKESTHEVSLCPNFEPLSRRSYFCHFLVILSPLAHFHKNYRMHTFHSLLCST